MLAGVGQHAAAQADSSRDQAWVLYEQGRARQEDRDKPEPGEALYLYRQAIERAGIFPEAEMAIGEIFFREGAYALAEEQFKKALATSPAFLIPEQKYLVRYRLADLYELQERYSEMEKQLLAILVDQSQWVQTSPLQLTDVIGQTYLRRGIDQVFTIYRMNDSAFATAAHAKLGWMTYRAGRFDVSITHSLFALDIVVSEAVREIRRTVPDFEYSTLEKFAATALPRPAVRTYLKESAFSEMLYYLATATHAGGRTQRAREVWSSIAALDPELSGRYAELSRRQLRSPWVDPYLNPSPRLIEYPAQ